MGANVRSKLRFARKSDLFFPMREGSSSALLSGKVRTTYARATMLSSDCETYTTGCSSNQKLLLDVIDIQPVDRSFVAINHRRKLRHKSGGLDGSYGERWARAYNGGLGAEPPAGSRAEPLGQGVKPSRSWKHLVFQKCKWGRKFANVCYLVNCSNSLCFLKEYCCTYRYLLAYRHQTPPTVYSVVPCWISFYCVYATSQCQIRLKPRYARPVHFLHRLFLALCIHDTSHP